jgi:hypothetical protein
LRRSNSCYRCVLGLVGLLMLFSVIQPYAARAAVTMVDMTATAQPDGTILVRWVTATELGTSSFRLYRDLAANGPWAEDKIVDEQPAQGDGATGATYNFSDDGVEAGKTYYYLLEEIDTNGNSTPLLNYKRSATALAPGQATYTPTSTSTPTRTATSGPSPTPTRTHTPIPTSTPWPSATDLPTDVPTATRQFTNTPVPPNTPTATQLPGQPTATRVVGSPTVTPITSPQLTTPTQQPGAVAPAVPPTATRLAVAAPPTAATATRTPTRSASMTPTIGVTLTPSATPSPAVFVAKATAEPILRGTPGRTTVPAAAQGDDGRNEGLALAIGGGAVLLAGLLGGAAFIIWRRRRS